MEQSILNQQVIRMGYWSAAACIAVGIFSLFLPLDAPGGYEALHADRVAWLAENRALFVLAWVIQILAMTTMSMVFLGLSWIVATRNALVGALAALLVVIATIIFIIPKFMAVWTIPLLSDAVSVERVSSGMADTLLQILNVSAPYSLFTAFDYLGFWMYAVFGLLAAIPLLSGSASSKVCAWSLGVYGVLYHAVMFAVMAGAVPLIEVESYALGTAMLLLVTIVAALFCFKTQAHSA